MITVVAQESGCRTPRMKGCDRRGGCDSIWLKVLLPYSTNAAWGVITRGEVAVVGALAAELNICCEASAANAMPGLSMRSAVGALVTDVLRWLAGELYIADLCSSRRHTCGCRKKHVVEPRAPVAAVTGAAEEYFPMRWATR